MKKLLFLLFLPIITSTSAWAAIARVGSASVTNNTSSGSWTHTLAQTPTVGDLIVIGISTQDGCGNSTSATVTDSASHSLTQAVANTGNGGTAAMDVYLFYEIVPSSITTSISITTTISGGGGCNNPYPQTSVGMEYSGVASSSTKDVTATGASGFTDPPITFQTSSATTTTTDVLIGVASEGTNPAQAGSSYTPAAGWNTLENYGSATPTMFFADRLNIAAGSNQFSGVFTTTPGTGTRLNSVFASFKVQTSTPNSAILSNAILSNATVN